MPNDILLEEVNPFGNIQAIVEVDSRTCYFYLFGEETSEFGTRSVWVRNLTAAPDALDVAGMRAGHAPLHPRANVREPNGSRAPRASDLRIVWLPEGNGAALFERDSIIAIIPPWSGSENFHGYASACVGNGPYAREMPSEGDQFERISAAERYWAAWDTDAIWPGEATRSSTRSKPRSGHNRTTPRSMAGTGRRKPCFAFHGRTERCSSRQA